MNRLWVRVVLVFAGVAALAAAGAFLWSSQRQARSADAALRRAADTGHRALVDASDLRAAQQSYVAVGQGEDFWFARVTSLTQDLDDVLQVFRTHVSSPEALAAVDTAAAALRDFRQVDARAREYTQARQLTQASDIIFGDGFELTQKLTAAVTEAVTADMVAHDATAARAERRQNIVAAGGAGVAALALLLLVRGARRPQPAAVVPEPKITGFPQPRDELSPVSAAARPRPPAKPEPPAFDAAAVAAICSDLARVADTRALPGLLERVSRVLDAAGIVLWIADPDGRELSPIVVHGYTPQMATRLGTISRDAANVTASAYRTGLMQIVRGDAVSNGAIAAPLAGAAGCLGVMAIEMRNGGEQREPLLAAATIIASQVSTLVGPPSTRARTEATG